MFGVLLHAAEVCRLGLLMCGSMQRRCVLCVARPLSGTMGWPLRAPTLLSSTPPLRASPFLPGPKNCPHTSKGNKLLCGTGGSSLPTVVV